MQFNGKSVTALAAFVGDNAVQYAEQTLTDEEKAQALANIGAVPTSRKINGLSLSADRTLLRHNIGVTTMASSASTQTCMADLTTPIRYYKNTNTAGITALTLSKRGTFEAAQEAWMRISFTSKPTTTITDNLGVYFTGWDHDVDGYVPNCVDGAFTPNASVPMRYDMFIWWDGVMWRGTVEGVPAA